ncbi:carbonic anhydrase [Amylocystis lapponica]|nr:carbonic anhydrase [Amylocystis lapponica]
MAIDPVLAQLLANNSQWAVDVDAAEPGFFANCAKGRPPRYASQPLCFLDVLWIGCADSRVPESVLTAARPGDIFVHRNIANQFHLTDDSALSVLTYAVDHLGATHVVIVGHTQCGGAAACHAAANGPPSEPSTPLERWLAPLTSIARDEGLSVSEIVEANVRAQVANVVRTDTVQRAWANGKNIWVHGWVYEIEKGKIRDMGISVGPS